MQVVGQRLIDLGLFIEIQGGTHFIVSNTVHYQFCSPTHPKTSTMDVREVKRYGVGIICSVLSIILWKQQT